MQRKSAFSRRGPDLVTEELVAVLTKKTSFEFKQLFDQVSRGMVKKTGKKYKGLASLAKALTPDVIPIPVAK
jgi:hypothetical protein